MPVTVPQAAARAILTNLAATGNEFHGANLHLYMSNTTPTYNSLLADFTLAVFDGYTDPVALTWSAPINAPGGGAEMVGTLVNVVATGTTTTPTIYGYYVTDAGGNLLYAERFAQPIGIANIGDAVTFVPVYPTGAVVV